MRDTLGNGRRRFHEHKLLTIEQARRVLIHHSKQQTRFHFLIVYLAVQVRDISLCNPINLAEFFHNLSCLEPLTSSSESLMHGLLGRLDPELLELSLFYFLQVPVLHFGDADARTGHLYRQRQLLLVPLVGLPPVDFSELVHVQHRFLQALGL